MEKHQRRSLFRPLSQQVSEIQEDTSVSQDELEEHERMYSRIMTTPSRSEQG